MTTELTNTEQAVIAKPAKGGKRTRQQMPPHGLSIPVGSERWIRSKLNVLRKSLETTLRALVGEDASNVVYCGLVITVLEHERRRQECGHILRTDSTLTVDNRLALLKAASNATRDRDAAVERLGIRSDTPAGERLWNQINANTVIINNQPAQPLLADEPSPALEASVQARSMEAIPNGQ